MAIVQNPLIGRARNRLGGAIMSKWRRFNTVRTLPLSYSDNPSNIVTFNRAAMIVLNNIANSNRIFINDSFSALSKNNQSFNTFFSKNRLLIDTSLMKINEIMIQNFLFSYGRIPSFSMIKTSKPVSVQLQFTPFISDSQLSSYPILLVNLIILDHYDNSFEVIWDAFPYNFYSQTISKTKPYPAYYFLFLSDVNRKVFSISKYIGKIL